MYVGMTGLTPEERLANHQAGIKDASLVKRYGVRLLPELYAHPGLYLFAAGGKKNLNSLSDYSAATAFALNSEAKSLALGPWSSPVKGRTGAIIS